MMNNTVKKMSEKSVEIIKNNVEKMKNKKEGGGSSSDESEFPNGMRVLVVDDSVVCLRVITALLHKCNYQVTPKQDSAEALILLTQNEDNFDIVLTNVHMHQIDGFKMLEAGLELDIPVIMTSASDDKEIIMKGIKHGARDFLLKPLRKEEIKNIWQHVYRKNLLSLANGREEEQDHSKGSRKMVAKRKAIEGVDEENERGKYRPERVRWTQPLHDQFVGAVEKLGGVDKAMPKKILELMGSPDITREKVASHLQKYRKAIKKKIELELEGQGIKNSNNDDNTIHHHHLHHCHLPSLLLPPPSPQVTFSGGTNLVGSTMAAAASNYPGQSSNLVVGGGYNPHALQVLPNSMVQQLPLQHFDTDDNLYDHSLNNFFDGVYSSLLDDNL